MKFRGAAITRRVLREALAVAFWLHAVMITQIFPIPTVNLPELPIHFYTIFLVVFIFNYSLFSERGWWSVLFDLLYLYFLPFIYAGKVAWWASKSFHRYAKKRIAQDRPSFIIEAPKMPKAEAAKNGGASGEPVAGRSLMRGFREGVLKLLSNFALLWSVIILTETYRPIVSAAIVATLTGTFVALFNLWNIFSGNSDWVDKAQQHNSKNTSELIKKLMEWNESTPLDEAKKTLASLKTNATIFNFVAKNKSLFSRWAFTASLAISVPFYAYISFLFGCVYFGIGKLQGLHYGWTTAMLDSLYMPFAWTELPTSPLIRLIGGLQAICVSVIGYNIFVRHLGSKLDKITSVASSLYVPFEDDAIKARIVLVDQALAKPIDSSTTVPAINADPTSHK